MLVAVRGRAALRKLRLRVVDSMIARFVWVSSFVWQFVKAVRNCRYIAVSCF